MRIRDWSADVCSSDGIGERSVEGPRFHAALDLLQICKILIQHPAPIAVAIVGIIFAVERRLFTRRVRSEEHTSELQSLMRPSSAVFCVKNKHKTNVVT